MQKYSKMALMPDKYLRRSITITGPTACGKTETIKYLRELLPGYIFVDASYIMTRLRLEFSAKLIQEGKRDSVMTKEEFTAFNRAHPEYGFHLQCDNEFKKEGQNEDRLHSGRLSYIFVPGAFHVIQTCPFELRAIRRWEDEKKSDPDITLQDVMYKIAKRDRDDYDAYNLLHSGWLWSLEDFDCQVSSEKDSGKIIAHNIVSKHLKWQRQRMEIAEEAFNL